MSRFSEDGDWDDSREAILNAGRWGWNLKQAIVGKRGQRVLRRLEEVLLAMPEHRLVYSELATPDGEVCAVGCLIASERARKSGLDFISAAKALAAEDETWKDYRKATIEDIQPIVCRRGDWVCVGDWIVRDRPSWSYWSFMPWTRTSGRDMDEESERTVDLGESAGLVRTLAWHLGWLNDEKCQDVTPEERHAYVLGWVRSQLKLVSV